MKTFLVAWAMATSTVAHGAAADFRTVLLNVSSPGTPVQVAIGDVDGDGRQELVVVTPSAPAFKSALKIYDVSTDGAATLEQSVALPAPPGSEWVYTQPRILDVDQDGDRDIALYQRADGQPGVLLIARQTRRGFTLTSFPMPETDAAYSFDMADIDGDGIADAVTANHGMNAPQTIFVSYGGSGFATSSSYPVPFNGVVGVFGPATRGLVHVYARDLDHDGRTDIAASTAPFNNFAARILFNKPTGMVARNVSGAPSIDFAVADMTNDGLVDLVMNGNQTPDLRIARGSNFNVFTNLTTPPDPRTPVVGDITRDGVRDIVVAPTFAKVLVVIVGGGGGSTTIASPELSAADFMSDSFVQELTMGDVDNDGDLDAIFATDRVIWLRHAGDVTPPVLSLPANLTAEATSPSGTSVTFIATATDETDGIVPVQCSPASGVLFPFGTTKVRCHATDAAGNNGEGSFSVTVRDTTAPSILSVSSSINTTRPDDRLLPVTIAVTATDAGDPAPVSTIASVLCETGCGAQIDWVITGPLSVSFRGMPAGNHRREYSILVRTVDRSGNASTAQTRVTFP